MMPHKHYAQVIARIMVVRIAVAKSEFMSFTPILAKTAVSAANSADSKAYNFHIFLCSFSMQI